MRFTSVTWTPVSSASPDYSSGDSIGTPYNVGFSSPNEIKEVSVTVVDKSNQGPAMRILWFKALPTGTYTDNAAIVISAADFTNLIGETIILNADYKTTDSKKIVTYANIQLELASPLYAVLVADAAWNAAAVDDLSITVGFDVAA